METEYARLWREDIVFLADQLRNHHANLYHTISKVQFDEAVSSLLDQIPNLSREEIIVEIARIVARIGDGHTSLWIDSNTSFNFHRYPLHFYEFNDGVVVDQTSPDHQQYLGARLVRVGSYTVEDALASLQMIASGDNDYMRRYKACAALNIPEFLFGLHLLNHPDDARYTLELATGETVTLSPPQRIPDEITAWVSLNHNETPLALWQRHPDKLYWFEFIEAHKLVYLNHRSVRDATDESLSPFSDRLFQFIEAHPVERLVIDLRQNGGGDNRLNQSLVHGLICCRKVNQPGRLFTVVGRQTFSAAMNLAVDLERNTHTLFVGEPTGASPNHYGENFDIALPNSGIRLTISIWYWQSSFPYDRRPWIEPHIPVDMDSTAYRNNVDPVLNAVLTYREQPQDSNSIQTD